METRSRRLSPVLAALLIVAQVGLALATSPAEDKPPVATDEATYAAYGRVFPDPHGCLSADTTIPPDDINDVVAPGSSPWAKGNICVGQYLQWDETIAGAKFLAHKFPRFLQIIRLDQAYDNPDFKSAGNAREITMEDGQAKLLGRDRRPLYLFKVTDAQSPIPEKDRLHFAYGLSIHGIERAGLEGGVRAMEDLVTWAATMPNKKIIEAPSTRPVPTAKETLETSVLYFMTSNPDGWGRGQAAPVETLDGGPNVNYRPGPFFQRYNGNGAELNREWPTFGYTYRPYSPGSEPEIYAYAHALKEIASQTTSGHFAGGLDLHGQLNAVAFSYTLTGGGQRDYRENFLTVETASRAWEDQSQRLAWSPYVADKNANGSIDSGETCVANTFCYADQWGTTIDTIGYTVTGDLGSWFESEAIGVGGVGLDNEMSLSHVAPNNVFEPALEQSHVDGNKGLIYSQLAALIEEQPFEFTPTGKVGYVYNPKRVESEKLGPMDNPGLPAQNDIDVIIPCQSAGPQNVDAAMPCKEPGVTFAASGTNATLEFDVFGPDRGVWNGGITVQASHPNAASVAVGTASDMFLDRQLPDGTWVEAAKAFHQGLVTTNPDGYLPAGQLLTTNDPIPGRWRVRLTLAGSGPVRVNVDFSPANAEDMQGRQRAFSASSMDFLTDLNKYIPGAENKLKGVTVEQILADPSRLNAFDSLVVVNDPFPAYADKTGTPLNLPQGSEATYYQALRNFAQGGGNLVLTDGALMALESMGVVPAGAVKTAMGNGEATSERYNFSVSGRGNVCATDPLTVDVCLKGTAGGNHRVAVEPTPLGYTPDKGLDGADEVLMPRYWVDGAAWQDGCGKDPVSLCTSTVITNGTGVGERHLGAGVIRIIGLVLPDPNFTEPNAQHDMRFGVADYAPTFSGFQIFLNTVNYQRA